MTRRNLHIMSGIVLAGLGIALVLQYQAQLRLRGENRSLLQQNTLLVSLEAENERLSNLVVQTSQSTPEAMRPEKELLRLRGEVGVLQRQNQELAKMLLGKEESPLTPGEDKGFEPSASWADAGNATPESAAETFCWAIRTGSSARLAEVLIPPENSNKDAAVFISEVSQGLEPLLSQIEASRLRVAETVTPDEQTYWFQNRLKGGETLISPLTLRRVGDQWKVKLSLGR